MRTIVLHITPVILLALTSCGTLSLNEVKNFDDVKVHNLGENVNSKHDDYAADLHEDRLLFTSTRPTIEGYIYGEDFWFTDRQGMSWTKALNLGASINTLLDEGSPHIVSDGEQIFFVIRGSEDGSGKEDIYSAELDFNGKWQKIQNLGEGVNTSDWDSHPFLAPDGEELYFASDRSGGYGGTDIYVSKLTRGGKWGTARNLGPEINTSGDETSPMMAPDGITLFFSSTGHPGLGGSDVFMAKKKDRVLQFTAPENIGRPMNSRANDQFFRLSAREDTIFLSSDRAGGYGGLDIWGFANNPYKDSSRYIFWVTGMVFDTTTKYGIRNSTLTVQPTNGDPFTMTLDNGRFRFRTELNQEYRLTGAADGFITETVTIEVPGSLYYNEFRKNIGLGLIGATPADVQDGSVVMPLPAGATRESIVFFQFNRATLVPETLDSVRAIYTNRLKPMIDQGQQFDVILNAYTCDIGTEQYNVGLSRRRAAAVSKMLRDLGVPVNVIEINAYGEVPIGSDPTERERRSNRRVEIAVVERTQGSK